MTVDQNEEALGMSNKAFRAIADALREQGAHFPRVGARLILDALADAGIELVELPEQEPDSVRVDGHRTVIYEDTVWLTPDQARADAAALLAAAQKAEEYRSGT